MTDEEEIRQRPRISSRVDLEDMLKDPLICPLKEDILRKYCSFVSMPPSARKIARRHSLEPQPSPVRRQVHRRKSVHLPSSGLDLEEAQRSLQQLKDRLR
jgi:hypothetical protein